MMHTIEELERIAQEAQALLAHHRRVFAVSGPAQAVTPAIVMCVLEAANGAHTLQATASPAQTPVQVAAKPTPRPAHKMAKRGKNGRTAPGEDEWWPQVEACLNRLSSDGYCISQTEYNAKKDDGLPSLPTVLKRLGYTAWSDVAIKAGLKPSPRGKRKRKANSQEELRERERRFRAGANEGDGDCERDDVSALRGGILAHSGSPVSGLRNGDAEHSHG